MKVWHMNCDACKRPGPEHENPLESIRLADNQGWGPITMGIVRLHVCPECRAEPARAFELWRTGRRPEPAILQSALP